MTEENPPQQRAKRGKYRKRAPATPPSQADWAAIRLKFELQGASLVAICDEFRIASPTSVQRRASREGWQRNIGHIADRLATDVVAFHQAPLPMLRAKAITIDGNSESAVPIPALNAALLFRPKKEPKPKRVKPEPEPKVRARREPPPSTSPPTLPSDISTMLTVFNLAQRQAVVRSQEIEGGDVLIGLGRIIVDALMRVVDINGDPDDAVTARRQLLLLNPDKDGLGTLAKVALGLIDGGTRLKRRAFAMDAKGADAPEMIKPSRGPARAILENLAPDVLLKLRAAAYEVSKLPRASISSGTPEGTPDEMGQD